MKVRLIKVLEDSENKEWNNKSFLCNSCAKKVQLALQSISQEEGFFENPQKVRN